MELLNLPLVRYAVGGWNAFCGVFHSVICSTLSSVVMIADLLLFLFLFLLSSSSSSSPPAVAALGMKQKASIMTGRDTFRTGMQYEELTNLMPWGLPLDEVTLAERFKYAGYNTHMVSQKITYTWRVMRKLHESSRRVRLRPCFAPSSN